jgi:hypothetical protein
MKHTIYILAIIFSILITILSLFGLFFSDLIGKIITSTIWLIISIAWIGIYLRNRKTE